MREDVSDGKNYCTQESDLIHHSDVFVLPGSVELGRR